MATHDMWLKATWGQVQFVARGGIVTISHNEAIGNNNPCDMVIYTKGGAGREVLTKAARIIRYDLEQQGIALNSGVEKFLKVAAREDMKSPYISKWNDFRLWMKEEMDIFQLRLKSLFMQSQRPLKKTKCSKTLKCISKER